MKDEQYTEIEQQIGYEFENRLLLQQAFTRKSYTEETHDGDNNEVLEFIGDKVLDLIIVKVLTEYYGDINERNEYECEYTEGKLTEFKKHLVESKMLAERIDELGFADYLIMGKGDKKNNVQNETHVKEDLFEAILGAVALDSGWDLDAMQDAVEMMLHLDCYLDEGFDEDQDYVSIIQRWQQKRIGELSGIFKRLYEDSVSGRITDERFMELSADYEQEQATLKARAAELQAELGQAQEAAVNVEKFMAVVRKYTSFEELTPTLLREFVEKIVVHECWKDEQGTRHQDIEIYYSFVGKVDLPDD